MSTSKTVFYFGNEYIEEDNLAIKIAESIKLEGFNFQKCDCLEEIMDYDISEIFLLDVVKGLDHVELINDLDMLKEREISTLHDFDLNFFLKLLEKLKDINQVNIIGIPQKGNFNIIKSEVEKILKS